jgi:hypothetical protein
VWDVTKILAQCLLAPHCGIILPHARALLGTVGQCVKHACGFSPNLGPEPACTVLQHHSAPCLCAA